MDQIRPAGYNIPYLQPTPSQSIRTTQGETIDLFRETESDRGLIMPDNRNKAPGDPLGEILKDVDQMVLDKLGIDKAGWKSLSGTEKLERLKALLGGLVNLNRDMTIARHIDLNLVQKDITGEDVRESCKQVLEGRMAGICLRSRWVSQAAGLLKDSPAKVVAVIGTQRGDETPAFKAAKTRQAIKDGADEIDMMMNMKALKAKDYGIIWREISDVVNAAQGHLVKVIIDTATLSDAEKVKACHLIKAAGAQFVKTSPGFAESKADAREIEFLKKTGKGDLHVNASGAITNMKEATLPILSGASRIDTENVKEILEEETRLKEALGDTGERVIAHLVKTNPDAMTFKEKLSEIKREILEEIEEAHGRNKRIFFLSGAITPNERSSMKENVKLMGRYLVRVSLFNDAVFINPSIVEERMKDNFKPLQDYGLNYFLFMNDREGFWPDIIRKCDGMFFVPGWKYSKGARDEYRIAAKKEIPMTFFPG